LSIHPARFIHVALATDAAPVAQAGMAATIAAFLGGDYRAAVPAAAAPIRDVLAEK
jgi:hypothetical protein